MLRKIVMNEHAWFMIGTIVAILLLQWDIQSQGNQQASNFINVKLSNHQHRPVYHGHANLGIDFTDYAKSLMYKLTLQMMEEGMASIVVCTTPQSDVFHRVDMTPRRADAFHTLADTNLHVMAAYLDDRVSGGIHHLRILGAGLYPVPKGRTNLYCVYDCEKGRCSSLVYGAVVVAGNHSDYPSVRKRLSLMDVMHMVCPVKSSDKPKTVTMSTSPCGVTHNYLGVEHLEFGGVVQPPWDVGVCGGVVDMSGLDASVFAVWLEYLRVHGVAAVHIYTHGVKEAKLRKIIDMYESETLRILYSETWDHISNKLDKVVLSELALNHCLYSNMRKYRYILNLSYNTWIILNDRYHHLKQLVRSQPFQSKMDEYGGLVVNGDDVTGGILIKSSSVLATAANHFVPFNVLPAHHVLDSKELTIASYKVFTSNSVHKNIILNLNETVNRKIKEVNMEL